MIELGAVAFAIAIGTLLALSLIGSLVAAIVPGDWSPAEGWFFLFLFLYLSRRRAERRREEF